METEDPGQGEKYQISAFMLHFDFYSGTTPSMDEMNSTIQPDSTETIIPTIETGRLGQIGLEDYSGASSDEALVTLWLKTKKSIHTRKAYGADAGGFLALISSRGLCLGTVKVADVQDWVDSLQGALSSQARRISVMKSLLTFAQKTGYITFNVGSVIEVPNVPNEIAERILTEEEVHGMLAASKGKNHVLIKFLYGSGVRISELSCLKWKHVHETEDGAVVTIHGKGGKTRHIPLSPGVSASILEFRNDECSEESLVFTSRTGKPLENSNVIKMLRRIAKKAGVSRAVSPHWFRHAHASHALDRGAPIHLVQSSLGHASVATTGRYLHAKPGDGSGRYLSI